MGKRRDWHRHSWRRPNAREREREKERAKVKRLRTIIRALQTMGKEEIKDRDTMTAGTIAGLAMVARGPRETISMAVVGDQLGEHTYRNWRWVTSINAKMKKIVGMLIK